MTALRLFLASGAALIAAIVWQFMVKNEMSERGSAAVSTIKGGAYVGMLISAFWAVKESAFWLAMIGTFLVLSVFSIYLPEYFVAFEKRMPENAVLLLPVVIAYIILFSNRGRIGKMF